MRLWSAFLLPYCSRALSPISIATSRQNFVHRYSQIPRQKRCGLVVSSLLFSSASASDVQTMDSERGTRAVSLLDLQFDNRNIERLAIDPNTDFSVSRTVPNAIFSLVQPTPVEGAELVAVSPDALALLDIDYSAADRAQLDTEITNYFSGNQVLPGSRPAAHCYCGFQFGSFAGQLGDGATMYLGEVFTAKGQRWELQLKGAGRTPFSRTADGRKVLRSSVREFLGSEALHYLGIPTTRSASCITSKSTVSRDPFYTGQVIDEKCTIITRIAPHFFRFGSFEIFKTKPPGDAYERAGPSAGNTKMKKLLLDHVCQYHPAVDSIVEENVKYRAFYQEVMERTVALVVQWQAKGFVHGVLNTDNMSLLGLTIDYGPYGFVEHFDKDFVPNGSDGTARYSYQRQEEICKWNLQKLSEILDPVLPARESSTILQQYTALFRKLYVDAFRSKFAIPFEETDAAIERDSKFIENFLSVLEETKTDFTDSFVAVTEFREALDAGTQDLAAAKEDLVRKLVSRCATPKSQADSLRRKLKISRPSMHPTQVQQLWEALQRRPEEVSAMFGDAPIDLLRQEIGAEKEKLDRLMGWSQQIQVLEMTSPNSFTATNTDQWRQWVNNYCSFLNLESGNVQGQSRAIDEMRKSNPTFILRNWIAQAAIEEAEKGNYSGVRTVLKMLTNPYDKKYSTFRNANCGKADDSENTLTSGDLRYLQIPPEWADSLICTCSS